MAKTENEKIAQYGPVVQLVASRTTPGKKPYEIRLKEGVYACNCTAWVFSKEVPKSCKHLRYYFSVMSQTQKAVQLTELQIVSKCLKTSGLYDLIRMASQTEQAFQHKMARLAQALLPYFGGAGEPVECMSSNSDVRLIYLED
jgi:hypothetical protein